MKTKRNPDNVIDKGVCFIEQFQTCQTKFGDGDVVRIWLKRANHKDDELLGYRVTAGYRKIIGNICMNLKEAIDSYEEKEIAIRKRIKKNMEG